MATPLNWAQKEAVQAVAGDLGAKHKKVYVDMPTRAGKTAVPLHILEMLERNGGCPSVTFLAERKEQVRNILDQARMFAPTLVERGLIEAHTSASLRKRGSLPRVRVMTYMGRTAAVLDGTLNPMDEAWLIEDEAQHVLSELRQDTHNRNPKAIHIALTASPEYNEDKGLPQAGYKLSYWLSRQKAIDGKLNAQTRSVVVEMENIQGGLDDIARTASDYSPEELDKLVRQTEVMENLIRFAREWHSPIDPRPIHQRDGFIFCNSIADSIATAQRWNQEFGKGSCVAVWGDMNPADQAKAIQAHEEGRIRWLASSRFAIEGMGKNHHDVVINKVPRLSAVDVKQCGGRVTGYDHNNPDKEALIADLVYPSERGDQLLYGDAIGGFLFEGKDAHEGKLKGKHVPNLTPSPLISGLTIAAMPNTVETFLHRRNEKRARTENRPLQRYTENVRERMQAIGLLSFYQVWARVQEVVTELDIEDGRYRNRQVSESAIKALMVGEGSYEDEKFLEYSKAAVVLAVALSIRPEQLFGPLSRVDKSGEAKLLRPIDYKDEDLMFNDTGVEPYDNDEAKPLLGTNEEVLQGILDMGDFDKVWDEEIDWDATEDAETLIHTDQLREKIAPYLRSLSSREERVLRARFGIGLKSDQTLEEVSKPLCVTGARIREIEGKALRSLRDPHLRGLLCVESGEIGTPIDITRVGVVDFKKDDIHPEIKKAVVRVAEYYREKFRTVSFDTVIRALEATLEINRNDYGVWNIQEFRKSYLYDALNLLILVDQGYDWGAQEIIDKPLNNERDEWGRKYLEEKKIKAKRVLELILKYKEKGSPKPSRNIPASQPSVPEVEVLKPQVSVDIEPQVAIEAARHYRERFKNEPMHVAIYALEISLGVTSERGHVTAEDFKHQHRYDAHHLLRLAKQGYDWGSKALLAKSYDEANKPFRELGVVLERSTFERARQQAERLIELLTLCKDKDTEELDR
ncbi:MAG: DEAD/DEAH box helicase family protein [Alphaproteobacteria bacterium]